MTLGKVAPPVPGLQPLFHRVVGLAEPNSTETKSASGLYVPTQLNPQYRKLVVTAVGPGSTEVPMPVQVGQLVVVPVEAIEDVLGYTVVNAFDIVGVLNS